MTGRESIICIVADCSSAVLLVSISDKSAPLGSLGDACTHQFFQRERGLNFIYTEIYRDICRSVYTVLIMKIEGTVLNGEIPLGRPNFNRVNWSLMFASSLIR